MRQQYGLRIRGEEFQDMPWDEFCDLVCGLNEQTPLVKLAQIRSETDPRVIKDFTLAQRREHAKWQSRKAKKRPTMEVEDFYAEMQMTLANLFG